jgi:hypothetical protein
MAESKEKIKEVTPPSGGYAIYTTDELYETIYYTNKLVVDGSFVKFIPFGCTSKTGSSKIDNESWILPERVIDRIVFKTIDRKTTEVNI